MTNQLSSDEFAVQLLKAIDAPTTPSNVAVVVAWVEEEGGGITDSDTNNQLNTTEPGFGGVMQSTGSFAYPSGAAGVAANAAVLLQPDYTAIVDAFRRSAPEGEIVAAIVASPWASSHYAGSAFAAMATDATEITPASPDPAPSSSDIGGASDAKDFLGAVQALGGVGFYVATKDGTVYALDGAPHWGDYTSLPAREQTSAMRFVGFVAEEWGRGVAGYALIASSWDAANPGVGVFRFNSQRNLPA